MSSTTADMREMAGKDDDQKPPQQQQQADESADGDDLPGDPEVLKRMLREERRRFGQAADGRAKERKAKEALTERLKWALDLEEKGHSPAEIQQILEQRSEAELKSARESGNVDKLIQNAREKAEKEAAAEREKRQKAESLVQRVLIDDRLNRLLDKYVEPKFKKAVFSMLRPTMETLEDPEDPYGVRTVVRVGDDYMSDEEWLKQWAETDEEATPFLKQSLASGGGAAGANAGKLATLQFKARKDMTAAQKSQYIRQHGLAAYNQLPWTRDSKGAA